MVGGDEKQSLGNLGLVILGAFGKLLDKDFWILLVARSC